MSNDIDPIQVGKMINAIETLEENVKKLSDDVHMLHEKISSGKGLMIGVLVTAGGLGAGATKILESLFK